MQMDGRKCCILITATFSLWDQAVDRERQPDKHVATMNSISRNNGGHQKGSLKGKIQDGMFLAAAPSLNIPQCSADAHFKIMSPVMLLLYPAGDRLATSTTLCLFCTLSRINEPSVNFWVSQSGSQCQTGLSCQPLASFQLDSSFLFPLGCLLVS